MSDYRQTIETTPELAAWYDAKYKEMGDGWATPAEECHRHLDDLGVPFDKTRTLLDVGCGAGHFLAEAEKRVTAVGCEISYVGGQLSRRRAPDSAVREKSIENWDYWEDWAPFDYVVSIGSLEHIVDLDTALDNIRKLLKPTGKFYFYCPNERWRYNDQPNERTMTDEDWTALFERHGLVVTRHRRWGSNQDNTAFIGARDRIRASLDLVIPSDCKINAGSGQRPFMQAHGWVNIDVQDKYGPDLVGDMANLPQFGDNSVEMIVSHHTIEHLGLGEADGFIKEAHRMLKPGGSLLVFVPDMRALAQRWLTRQISDYTYMVNVYGAYMGDGADRHKWGYTSGSLAKALEFPQWSRMGPFNWRPIPGADIARAWWILGMEAVK